MDGFGFSLLLVGVGASALFLHARLRALESSPHADYVARFARHVPVAWLMIMGGLLGLASELLR